MGGTWSAIVRGAQRRERDRRRCGPTREDHNWTAAVHRRGLLAFLVSYSPLARARPRSGETKVPETWTCGPLLGEGACRFVLVIVELAPLGVLYTR